MSTIRVSVEGQDVREVPDWQALFSSEYPLLKIAYQGDFVCDTSTLSPQTIVAHGLGYAPMFFIWVNWEDYSGDPGYAGITAMATSGANTLFRMDNTHLWFEALSTAPGGLRIRYMVFHQDLDEQYDFSNIATATKPYGNLTAYGIKATPVGFDASEESDMRNFSIHTATRSMPIHMIRQYQSTGSPYVFSHGLGYPPFTVHWQKFDANPYWQLFGSAAGDSFLVTTDSTNVTHDPGGIGGLKNTILVYKDPYNLV